MANEKNQNENQMKFSTDSQMSTISDSGNELCPPAVSRKGFKIGQYLGSGSFSKVYKASWDAKPGVDLACKRFDLTEAGTEEWREKCLKQEMKIMLKLSHPNIIKAYDVIKTRKAAFIFMKFAKNGNIEEYMQKRGKALDESKARLWFNDIMSAVHYLHNKGIAHRDIKLENFLLDENESALLSDFGFSCLTLDKSAESLMKGTICGSDFYKAPEVHQLKDGCVYDAKMADMYAMGVCLFEMLNFDRPFTNEYSKNPSDYVKKQKSRSYFFIKTVSDNAIDLINFLLEPDPKRRIKAEKAIKHKWLSVITH